MAANDTLRLAAVDKELNLVLNASGEFNATEVQALKQAFTVIYKNLDARLQGQTVPA